MAYGDNQRKLIAARTSQLLIPPRGGLGDALNAIQDPKQIVGAASKAWKWVREAIDLVKAAPDNPFGGDDEAIAAEIIRRLEEKKRQMYLSRQLKR